MHNGLREVADKMKSLREEKGLSVFEVAAAVDCDPTVLNEIETGIKEPSMDLLKPLATYYGISAGDFLGESQPVPRELAELGVEFISYSDEVQDREMTPEKVELYKKVVAEAKEKYGQN